MSREKQDKFIILKKVKYGEADLIIHALGSNGSKYSFMARSALKSKKRFGGGILEPLHYVSLSYKDNSDAAKMKTLNEATLIDDFKNIRESYDRLELALFVLNCVSHVSLEGDANSDFLFNLTGNTLRAVSQSDELRVLRLHFCLKFLYQQGVISIEPWMSAFLKLNISDTNQLSQIENSIQFVEDYLDSIESLVMQYIKTADAGFS
jgi:DNA repair protein RecO (recombination protein O)